MMDGQPPPPPPGTEVDFLTQLLSQRKMVNELQKDVIKLVNRINRQTRAYDEIEEELDVVQADRKRVELRLQEVMKEKEEVMKEKEQVVLEKRYVDSELKHMKEMHQNCTELIQNDSSNSCGDTEDDDSAKDNTHIRLLKIHYQRSLT